MGWNSEAGHVRGTIKKKISSVITFKGHPVRARVCDGLGFLGIELEEKRNAANECVISAAASRVAVRVIRTDEKTYDSQDGL